MLDAQTACDAQGPDCSGVYDVGCDGHGVFATCSSTEGLTQSSTDCVLAAPATVCAAGTYGTRSLTDPSLCSPCEAGKFASAGNVICAECPVGTYQPLNGSDGCSDCAPGTSTDGTGSARAGDCAACDAGRFSADNSGCQDCEPGMFAEVAGQHSCEMCPTGKLSSVPASTSSSDCTDCPVGQFSTPWRTRCSAWDHLMEAECFDNKGPQKYTNLEVAMRDCTTQSSGCIGVWDRGCNDGANIYLCRPGSESGIDIQVGFSRWTRNEARCVFVKPLTVCKAGTYSSDTTITSPEQCDMCPAGKYSEAGLTDCRSCTAGKYTATAGQSSCSWCLHGMHAANGGMQGCEGCPVGQVSASGTAGGPQDRCIPAPPQAELDFSRDLAAASPTCFGDLTEPQLAQGLCGWHVCPGGLCKPGIQTQRHIDCKLIDGVARMRDVNLVGCDLRELPDSLAAANKIHEFYISHNMLTTLPCDALQSFTELRRLTVRENELEFLGDSCFAGTHKLGQLHLEGNRLTRAPEFPTPIPGFGTLSLSRNRITSLPESYNNTQLPQLHSIFAAYNNLHRLPTGLIRHGQLLQVHASGNLNDMLTAADTEEALRINTRLRNIDLSFSDPNQPVTGSMTRVDAVGGPACAFDPARLTCDFTLTMRDISGYPVAFGGGEWLAVFEQNDAMDIGRRALQAPQAPGGGGSEVAFTARDNQDGTYTFEIPMEFLASVGTRWASLYYNSDLATFHSVSSQLTNPYPLHVLPIDCSANPLKKTSDDGRECVDRTCPQGEYDATSGELKCFAFDYDSAEFQETSAASSSTELINGVLCRPCPADCTRCAKLESDLIIEPGYGVSEATAAQATSLRNISGQRSIFKCPVPTACLGETADVNGVANSTALCAEGHEGPLCARCSPGYLQSSPGNPCTPCPVGGIVWSEAAPILAVLPVGILAKNVNTDFDASVQGKVLIGTVQLITSFSATYQIKMPEFFSSFLDKLKFMNFDFSSVFALQCTTDGAGRFYTKFWASMMAPIAFSLLIFLIGCCCKANGNTMTKFIFICLFLLYPGVSQRSFSTFDCHALDNGESWLRADYSVDCHSSTHAIYRLIAVFFLLLYPFGVPLIFLGLLRKNKHQFLDRTHPNHEASRSKYGFLVDDYSDDCYYWEPVELSTLRESIDLAHLSLFLSGLVAVLSPRVWLYSVEH